MNYKVLYRKYRPTTFDEVIGQKTSVELLKNGILNDKLSHAYIFSGPRGTGKTSSAKIFAKTINCLNSSDGNCCNKCDNCLNFSTNPDIYEIDAASNNGVDQIREIIENIKLAPLTSKYKVYIIDEVHMLSDSAFNALLLTLEEPPANVVFILATTDIQKVPITVLSRCQRIDFKRISTLDIYNHLLNVCKLEKIDANGDALNEIAEYSDGGLRDALSILDQLSKNGEKITLDSVLDGVGIVSNKQVCSLIDDLNQNNINSVRDFIEKISSQAMDYKTVVKKIVNEIKNRCLNIKTKHILDRLSYDDYLNIAEDLTKSLITSSIHINSYDFLMMILLKYVDNSAISTDNLIKTNITKEKHEEVVEEVVLEPEKIDVKEELNDNIFESKKDIKEDINNKEEDSNKLMEFKNARINNCSIKCSKTYKEKFNESWVNYLETIKDSKIKKIVCDTILMVASDEYLIIQADFDDKSNLFNENLLTIEESFNKFNNSSFKLICISKDEWDSISKQIMLNKKNKVDYIEDVYPLNNEEIVDIFADCNVEIR